MITFKRNTPTIDTTLANTSKYLNQMQFTGITEENNLFVICYCFFYITSFL